MSDGPTDCARMFGCKLTPDFIAQLSNRCRLRAIHADDEDAKLLKEVASVLLQQQIKLNTIKAALD